MRRWNFPVDDRLSPQSPPPPRPKRRRVVGFSLAATSLRRSHRWNDSPQIQSPPPKPQKKSNCDIDPDLHGRATVDLLAAISPRRPLRPPPQLTVDFTRDSTAISGGFTVISTRQSVKVRVLSPQPPLKDDGQYLPWRSRWMLRCNSDKSRGLGYFGLEIHPAA